MNVLIPLFHMFLCCLTMSRRPLTLELVPCRFPANSSSKTGMLFRVDRLKSSLLPA